MPVRMLKNKTEYERSITEIVSGMCEVSQRPNENAVKRMAKAVRNIETDCGKEHTFCSFSGSIPIVGYINVVNVDTADGGIPESICRLVGSADAISFSKKEDGTREIKIVFDNMSEPVDV